MVTVSPSVAMPSSRPASQAHDRLVPGTGTLSENAKIPVPSVQLHDQFTQRGDSQKTFSLPWQIVLAPKHVIDFTIVDSLHSKNRVAKKSPEFESEMYQILPEYELSRRWAAKHPAFLDF